MTKAIDKNGIINVSVYSLITLGGYWMDGWVTPAWLHVSEGEGTITDVLIEKCITLRSVVS